MMNSRICKTCGLELPIEQFPKGRCVCKECVKKEQKSYARKYYEKNKEYFKKKSHEYNIANMRYTLRLRMYEALHRKSWRKNASSEKLLGADIETVKGYIERQFKEGMSWENHGEWHIDHIIPLSTAKTKEEIYKLFHYTNLQPLWAVENLKKYNKI